MRVKFSTFSNPIKTGLSFLFLSILVGCHLGEPAKEKAIEEGADVNAAKLFKVDKVTFSVPSPIQISMMIKKSGANYNKAGMNSSLAASNYSTNFSKAINLGIYGADLGYATIYDQTQDAIAYINVIKQLSDGLGISGAFEKRTLERFQNNIGVKDSVLAIITEAFRNSDGFLKQNERKDIGALLVAGGWIEALCFMTNVVKTTNNQEMINRIGEQKVTLDNLVKLLMGFQEQKEVGALIDQFLDLSNSYEGIQFTYKYKEPTIDSANKMTTINSESSVNISKEQLASITEKINKIRSQIIK